MSKRTSNLLSNENIFNNIVEVMLVTITGQHTYQYPKTKGLRNGRNNDNKQDSKHNTINLEGKNNLNKINSKIKYRNDIPIVYHSTFDNGYTQGSKLREEVKNIWTIIPYGTQIEMNIVRGLAKIIRSSFDNNPRLNKYINIKLFRFV